MAEPIQLVIGGAPHSGNPAVFPPLQPVIDRLGLGSSVVLPGRISETDKSLNIADGAAFSVDVDGQEDALVHWAGTQGLRARPLHLVGYDDEEEATDAAEAEAS